MRIELSIVMASDVRRYAKGELLPRQQREAVEQALIDDDRARRLVINTIPAENVLRDIPETTSLLLGNSLKACVKSIRAYEDLLMPRHLPETVARLATIRHHARKSMFADIARHCLNLSQEDCDFGYVSMPAEKKRTALEDAIGAAAIHDRKLLSRLSEAYAAPAAPFLKAEMAAWISEIHEDTTRIAWL